MTEQMIVMPYDPDRLGQTGHERGTERPVRWKRSSHRALLAGLLFGLTAVSTAQERSSDTATPDEQLATYLRAGRYADARRLIDKMLRTEPREDLRNVRAVFAAGPNMGIQRRAASFGCEVTETGVRLPVTVDGKPVNWLLDTGANISIMSDAEAGRLGLAIQDSDGRAADLAGGATAARTATARRVVIGRTQLRDVSLLVTPADQMPWKELPPGRQGIIGLPLVLALDAVQWTRAGLCRNGSAVETSALTRRAPNLQFHRLSVVTDVEVEGRRLEFLLDTGNQAGTQLWERFGRDFQTLIMERGTKGTVKVSQVGGATDREVVVIPALRVAVGGKETVLARGNVFSRPVGDDRHHGLLGMDVLSQAAEVTIDFRSMTLTLR